jgi:hypothetical protein
MEERVRTALAVAIRSADLDKTVSPIEFCRLRIRLVHIDRYDAMQAPRMRQQTTPYALTMVRWVYEKGFQMRAVQ